MTPQDRKPQDRIGFQYGTGLMGKFWMNYPLHHQLNMVMMTIHLILTMRCLTVKLNPILQKYMRTVKKET